MACKRGILAADRIKAVLSKRDVQCAYVLLTLWVLAQGLEDFCGMVMLPYATSSFGRHSMLSTAGVIQRVLIVVSYPLFSRITDNTSRIGWYLFLAPLVLATIQKAMMSTSTNIGVYVGANVFAGLAETGAQLMKYVYIAETTSITSRGLYNVLADSIGTIVSMYAGSEIGGKILSDHGTQSGWRLGYWVWCIVEVLCAAPFIVTLFLWSIRSKKAIARNEVQVPSHPPRQHHSVLHQIWFEYDILGTCLFGAGIALVLVPLTLARGNAAAWVGSNLAMVIIGAVFLILFGLWDCLPNRLRPHWLRGPTDPLIPFRLLSDRSVLLICLINALDFMSYAIMQSYYTTFMQVAVGVSPARATQIDNSIRVTFTVFAVFVGLAIRFWSKITLGKLKYLRAVWFVIPGVLLCAVAVAMDIYFVMHPNKSGTIAGLVMAKILWGIGRALYRTTNHVAIQAAASRGELSIATSIFAMASSIGGTVGTAISGAIWLNVVPDQLAEKLPASAKAKAAEIYGSMVVAQSYLKGTPEREAIDSVYADTLKIMAIVSLVCLGLALVAACCMRWSLIIETVPSETAVVADVDLDNISNQNVAPGDTKLDFDTSSTHRKEIDQGQVNRSTA